MAHIHIIHFALDVVSQRTQVVLLQKKPINKEIAKVEQTFIL